MKIWILVVYVLGGGYSHVPVFMQESFIGRAKCEQAGEKIISLVRNKSGSFPRFIKSVGFVCVKSGAEVRP